MLFPISGDKIQLTTAAVAGSDAVNNGILINSLGTLARSATSGGVATNNGLLMSATGQVVYVDATAGLPANTQYVNGLPCNSAGALCVSTGSMSTYSNGIPFVTNGAVACTVTP
jgi:hypothetical protein